MTETPDLSADLDAIDAALASVEAERGSPVEAGRASMTLIRRDFARLRDAVEAAETETEAARKRAAAVEHERDRAAIGHRASNLALADRIRQLEAHLAEIRGFKEAFLSQAGPTIDEYGATIGRLTASLTASLTAIPHNKAA